MNIEPSNNSRAIKLKSFSVESIVNSATATPRRPPSSGAKTYPETIPYNGGTVTVTPDLQPRFLSAGAERTFAKELDQFMAQLKQLASSAAALFVDRHHRIVNKNYRHLLYPEYVFDYNHALHHCGLPDNYLNINDYFDLYVKVMFHESVRLNERLQPTVSIHSLKV